MSGSLKEAEEVKDSTISQLQSLGKVFDAVGPPGERGEERGEERGGEGGLVRAESDSSTLEKKCFAQFAFN